MNSLNRAADDWCAWTDFAETMRATPDAPALEIAGKSWTYAELDAHAKGLSQAISATVTGAHSAVTAVYADRSLECYAGVLAALMCGHAYVPLNPKFPESRNRGILQRSGASSVVVAPAAREKVQALVADRPIGIVSERHDATGLAPLRSNDCAYILFTSGSTGEPKGVPISHANLHAYLTAASAVTDFGPGDRFSQNFDLTFDLSVHDMFLCWRSGGTLVVPDEADLERPGDYIRTKNITCWFSVPSLAQKMYLQGELNPGSLAGIRHSLFCGEALPLELAANWKAATGSVVENWYGPTEATIACTRFVVPPNVGELATHLGLTPIGACLPGMAALVLNENLEEVPPGGVGELYMSGPQVTTGYLNDPEKTARSFVTISGRDATFYRTGDRVKSSITGELQFIDRTDNQIKFRGYRIEIGEIEAVIRDNTGGHSVVVTPLPLKSPTPTALVASIEAWPGDTAQLLEQIRAALPAYMVPTALRVVAEFPKNASGKVDRGAIGRAVDGDTDGPDGPPKKGVRAQLIRIARRINPAMSRQQIMDAPDLMEAGLDSLAFTEFTVVIEKRFGIELDQSQVADMAEMALPRLTRFIKKKAGISAPELASAHASAGDGSKKKRPRSERMSVHYKSRRTIECIRAFPNFVEAAEYPIALFFGSSGVVSGIDAQIVERRAAEMGHKICAANLGMAKLTNLGTTELIEFARSVIREQRKQVAFAVYELDVMQLSTLPTGREVEIVRAYLSGEYKMDDIGSLDPSNTWLPETGGTVFKGKPPKQPEAEAPPKEPNWNLKREKEVVATYLGKTGFVPVETEIWLSGVEMLKSMTSKVQAFVHPINNEQVNQLLARRQTNKFNRLISTLEQRGSIPIAMSSDFDLVSSDFRNFGHTNMFSGREKVSTQLVNMVLSDLDSR